MIRFEHGEPHVDVARWTLPCGLDVIVDRDDAVPQACVSIWYRAGSSDERAELTGFAHLFEHLFKNSLHIPAHHYDILRRAGSSEANASTSADRTAYHEVVPANELALALWLESDRMGYFWPGMTAERLAVQQSVVRAERRQRYENVPYGEERFALAAALYPEGHPHRYLTIGLHEHIQGATLDDVRAWYRTWYVPANATLVITGDVELAETRALVDHYFGSFPASMRPDRPDPQLAPPAAASVEVTDRFAALTRIHRTWLGPRAFEPDEAPLDLLTQAWCAVGTGALWRRLVYETQLAQRVSAWTVNSRLAGEIHVAVDLRSGADPAAVRAILDEECARGIDDEAITRAATRREAGAIWGLSGLSRRAGILQRYALYTPAQLDGLAAELAAYRAVTPATIDRVLARWLLPAHMIEVATVPASDRG